MKHSFQNSYFWIPIAACHLGGVIGCWIYSLFIELHWPDSDSDMDTPQESKATRVFDISSRMPHYSHVDHRDCPVANARHCHHGRPVDAVSFRTACFDSNAPSKTFSLK